MPISEEVVIEPAEMICGSCGRPYEAVAQGSSDELDFEIFLRRKRTRRPIYRPACECAGNRALIQARRRPS